MSLESAAVDTRQSYRHVHAWDGEERKHDDFTNLVSAALHKAGSKKALLPTKSKKTINEVNLRDLTRSKRRFVVEQALESEDADAAVFFGKLKDRFERAHVDLASVEVRFKHLSVNAEVAVGARGEPTVWNAYRNQFESILQKVGAIKPSKTQFCILDDVSGTLRPGRITLLLGPPGAGKSTLLNALAGRMQKTAMHVTGDITYNGKGFDQFRAVHTASYVDQDDLHLPMLTVKETLDFASRVQGVGHKLEDLRELHQKEKEAGIEPDWEMDTFTKAAVQSGKRESIATDLMLKLLGLDVCADTLIGSDQIRGVSGGQRKRVTTGELLVGPKKTLFLDEISTGLDSSTTFQITRTLRDFSHLRQATMLVALLQPTPETYNLFDDILLMSEGKMVYHGPREDILPFFESQGMHCPPRKADSDFLQEVTSRKDQQQYWSGGKDSYRYIPVRAFSEAFQQTPIARGNMEYLEQPYESPNPKLYWMNPLNYATKAIIINEFTANHWQGDKRYPYAQGIYPANTQTLGDGILHQLSQTTHYWWCWLAIGVCLAYILLLNLLIPILLTFLPPYGSSATHMVTDEALAERRAALEGDPGTDNAVKVNMPQEASMHQAQPVEQPEQPLETRLTYPRRTLAPDNTQGHGAIPPPLESPFLQRLDPVTVEPSPNGPDVDRWDSAEEPTSKGAAGNHGSQKLLTQATGQAAEHAKGGDNKAGQGMVLPFDPMTMTFKDLHYFVPIPKEAAVGKEHVHQEGGQAMLELLLGISGAFRPGVLTCLMGVSGAGKTTLMDVLAGRKTSGKIEGDVRINGYPKEQASFARVSGYVEQFDTHTAAATVYEALLFSGTLRNGKEVDPKTTKAFVDQVLGLVELQTMRGAVVGRPGQTGLSVEQRKRLTIAVELVANPSIVFMDEPTSGLDARAAAIVMRTVRNIVNTGRTIVCTIHQPSIDIFESFDELLLLKRGGETIFNGQLGVNSDHLIEYFQSVKGVTPIGQGMNPATWMLEVTTAGMESKLGVSFAEYYASSDLAKHYASLLQDYSAPVEGSKQLKFDDKYPKPILTQFWAIFAKYTAAYWRMPEYNGTRILLALAVGFLFGAMFWRLGDKVSTQGGLVNVLGALYATTLFFSIINATVIQPVISAERAVSYRERAAGMYSVLPWTLALGCVEIIYIAVQGTLYCFIVYWMCYFQVDAGKFFWFLLFNLLTLTYFTFFGMLAVALTPTLQLAAVCSAYLYSMFNLFAGFSMTQPNMPGWWIWMSYMNPIFWSVYGLIISQVDNLDTGCTLITGQVVPVYDAVLIIFGYHRGMLGWIVLILIAWVFVNWTAAYLALSKLNYLQR